MYKNPLSTVFMYWYRLNDLCGDWGVGQLFLVPLEMTLHTLVFRLQVVLSGREGGNEREEEGGVRTCRCGVRDDLVVSYLLMIVLCIVEFGPFHGHQLAVYLLALWKAYK